MLNENSDDFAIHKLAEVSKTTAKDELDLFNGLIIKSPTFIINRDALAKWRDLTFLLMVAGYLEFVIWMAFWLAIPYIHKVDLSLIFTSLTI